MANMFSGNIKKEIPKNIEECYKTDPITQNLWVWAERLERWGLVICVFMAIVGVIEIISTGIQVAEILSGYNQYMSTDYYSVSDAVFDCLLNWVFYCFLEFCVYHVLALLVGSLATIVQNTKISANVAIYNLSKGKNETPVNSERQREDTVFNDTQEKDMPSPEEATFLVTKNDTIICSQCKFEQPSSRRVCWHCGAHFKDNNRSTPCTKQTTKTINETAQKQAKDRSTIKALRSDTERWKREISLLSTEELKARYADEYEWSEKYRELCHEEMQARKNNQETAE